MKRNMDLQTSYPRKWKHYFLFHYSIQNLTKSSSILVAGMITSLREHKLNKVNCKEKKSRADDLLNRTPLTCSRHAAENLSKDKIVFIEIPATVRKIKLIVDDVFSAMKELKNKQKP